jgi:hypothetical protein
MKPTLQLRLNSEKMRPISSEEIKDMEDRFLQKNSKEKLYHNYNDLTK